MVKKYLKIGVCLTAILVCEAGGPVFAASDSLKYDKVEISAELLQGNNAGGEKADEEIEFVKGWNGEIDKNNKCYFDEFGNQLVGLQNIDGKTYYFDTAGIVQTGWQDVEGQFFYFSPETGERYESGSFTIDGEQWCFDEYGAGVNISVQTENDNVYKHQDICIVENRAVSEIVESVAGNQESEAIYTGWYLADEGWYYYDSDGSKCVGWKVIGQFWYYFDENGLMVSGEKKDIAGGIYYFGESGNMLTGWINLPEGWYWADEYGRLQTGWRQIGIFTYYFDNSTATFGLMAANCEKMIDGKMYYFGESGNLLASGWLSRPEGWYWIDDNGDKTIGWKAIGKFWYYFDENGLMASNIKRVIQGSTFCFGESGNMLTGWIKQPEGWYWADEYGRLVSGWQDIGIFRYYFEEEGSEYPFLMLANCTKVIDGVEYVFTESGALRTGWVYDHGDYYYYINNQVQTGWLQTNGSWYYLDPDNSGKMLYSQWFLIDNEYYYFYASGAMAKGWLWLSGGWYYLSEYGRMVTGWQLIGNDWYYFYKQNDPNGGGYGVMAANTIIDGYRLQANGAMIVTEQYNMSIRAQSYSSSTSYLILVDRAACKVGIFTGRQGAWNFLYFWDCAPGTAATPTVSGVFTVQSKGYYFDSGSSRCYWYTQFYGNYLFHSVLYSKYTGDLVDGRVGIPLSHGCVRLVIGNAKWIYDNIPSGTKVVVY